MVSVLNYIYVFKLGKTNEKTSKNSNWINGWYLKRVVTLIGARSSREWSYDVYVNYVLLYILNKVKILYECMYISHKTKFLYGNILWIM